MELPILTQIYPFMDGGFPPVSPQWGENAPCSGHASCADRCIGSAAVSPGRAQDARSVPERQRREPRGEGLRFVEKCVARYDPDTGFATQMYCLFLRSVRHPGSWWFLGKRRLQDIPELLRRLKWLFQPPVRFELGFPAVQLGQFPNQPLKMWC